jgi:hypothetical protein
VDERGQVRTQLDVAPGEAVLGLRDANGTTRAMMDVSGAAQG